MTLPIFPLPNSILFPGVYVPFHIFEERYKTMLKKIQESGEMLAVSYAPEMQPGKYYPSMVCGVGEVRVLKKTPNGESDILVFGMQRVRFDRYVQEVPYLIGEGEILHMDREMPKKTEQSLLTEIRDMLINWIFVNFDNGTQAMRFFKTMDDLEVLSNFITYYFVADIEKKQKLLEENNLEAKAQVVWQVLKDMEGTGPQEGGPSSGNLIIFPGSGKDDGHMN